MTGKQDNKLHKIVKQSLSRAAHEAVTAPFRALREEARQTAQCINGLIEGLSMLHITWLSVFPGEEDFMAGLYEELPPKIKKEINFLMEEDMKERGEYGSDECHVNPTFMRIWPYYLSEAIFLDMLGNNFGDVISCGEDVYVFDEENEGFTAAMLDNQIDVAQDVTDLLLEYFVLPTKAFVESNAPPKLGLGILDLGALNEAVQDALEDEEDLLGAVDAWLPHRYEESFLADQSAENLVNMGYTKH